jgi:hypothetical protein
LGANGNDLQNGYDGRRDTEVKYVRVKSIFGLTVFSFLLRFFLSVIRWKHLYDERRFLGATLINRGELLSALSLILILRTSLRLRSAGQCNNQYARYGREPQNSDLFHNNPPTPNTLTLARSPVTQKSTCGLAPFASFYDVQGLNINHAIIISGLSSMLPSRLLFSLCSCYNSLLVEWAMPEHVLLEEDIRTW